MENSILLLLSSILTFLTAHFIYEVVQRKAILSIVLFCLTTLMQIHEERNKRKTAENLRWTERVGRTRAEKVDSLLFYNQQNLRKVIEDKRKEVDGDGYLFKPIAYARSCYVHCQGVPRQPGLVPLARSRIDIEEWVPPPTFDDLSSYSHIWVIFVFHMNTNISTLQKSQHEKGVTFPVDSPSVCVFIPRPKCTLPVCLAKALDCSPRARLIARVPSV